MCTHSITFGFFNSLIQKIQWDPALSKNNRSDKTKKVKRLSKSPSDTMCAYCMRLKEILTGKFPSHSNKLLRGIIYQLIAWININQLIHKSKSLPLRLIDVWCLWKFSMSNMKNETSFGLHHGNCKSRALVALPTESRNT